MNAHRLKTKHVGYGCSCVIHNFSSILRIERPAQSNQTLTPYLPSSFVSQAAKGCYDAAGLLFFLAKTRRLIVDAAGERIDAEACDGFETGEG